MQDKMRSARSRQALLFAQNFLKHPKMIGSFIPSSRYLVDRLLGEINWETASTIVEYGPGVGTITSQVLRRMRPDAKLIVIEMNEDFVQYLRATFDDERLHVVHGSAEHVRSVLAKLGIDGADAVISGIPFTVMPKHVRSRILRDSKKCLRKGGKFIVFQFTGAVLPHLRSEFSNVRVGFEPLNILPARLFFCHP
jgi:phospholipid N-methyltransferase